MEKLTTEATLPAVGFQAQNEPKTDWEIRKEKDQLTLQIIQRFCSRRYREGTFKRPDWHKKVTF